MPELYPYQMTAVNEVIRTFNTCQSVMLQMPTGTGKTTVFCEIIKRNVVKKSRILVLVHTRELVSQIVERLLSFGLPAGIILAGEKKLNDINSQVQVASIQTLTRREINDWPENVSLIVIDEAHHASANTYQLIINHYKDKILKPRILGVTATPFRTNNTGFKGTFEMLVQSLTIKQFIEEGWLAGFKHMATKCPELTHVKINKLTNDYDESELATIMSEKTIMSDIIESYKEYGNNKKSIVFAVNRAHSKLIVERFKNEDINADYIDSQTNKTERENKIQQFKDGKIQVLCNVQIFTEGFDCPDISVVQLARPTKSLVLYLQMVGRGLRKKKDNSQTIILDNAGLWKKHGLVTKNHKWDLEGIKKDESTLTSWNSKTGEVVEITPKNVVEVEGLGMEELIEIKELTELDFILKFKVTEEGNRQTSIINGRKLEITYETTETINASNIYNAFDNFIFGILQIVNKIVLFIEPTLRLYLDNERLQIRELTKEQLKKCKDNGKESDDYKLLTAKLINKILENPKVKDDVIRDELKKLAKASLSNYTATKKVKKLLEKRALEGTYLNAMKKGGETKKEVLALFSNKNSK